MDLRCYKIVIVGDGNAGKTSLIYRLEKGEIPEAHVPTIMENTRTSVEALDIGPNLKITKKVNHCLSLFLVKSESLKINNQPSMVIFFAQLMVGTFI